MSQCHNVTMSQCYNVTMSKEVKVGTVTMVPVGDRVPDQSSIGQPVSPVDRKFLTMQKGQVLELF